MKSTFRSRPSCYLLAPLGLGSRQRSLAAALDTVTLFSAGVPCTDDIVSADPYARWNESLPYHHRFQGRTLCGADRRQPAAAVLSELPLGVAQLENGMLAQPGQAEPPQVETLCFTADCNQTGIGSIYAQFEPDGYDGQDADWQASASHSVSARAVRGLFHPGNRTETAAAGADAATSDAKFGTPRSNGSAFATASGTCAGRGTLRPA